MRFLVVGLVLVLSLGFVCGFESEVYQIGVGVPEGDVDDSGGKDSDNGDNVVVSSGGGRGSRGVILDSDLEVDESGDSGEDVESLNFSVGDFDSSGVNDEGGFFSKVTGAVVGVVGSTGGIVVGVVIVLVVAGFVFVRVRRNR